MSDERLRRLERSRATGDQDARAAHTRELRRHGLRLVAHVVQFGGGGALCEIRIATAGVKVRGRGGRARATEIIDGAGSRDSMATSRGMRGVLERLRDRDIATPFLELREYWEQANGPAPDSFRAQTLVDHGLANHLPSDPPRANGRWVSYFTSGPGKDALCLLHVRAMGETPEFEAHSLRERETAGKHD